MDFEFVHSRLQKASELLDSGKPHDALTCLDEVEQHVYDSEDRIEFASLRAWALSQLEKVDQALEMLAPLIEEYPENARLHATRGVVLSHANRLGEARDSLESAAALDDCDGVAIANLGFVYEKLHELESAVRAYDRALELGADVVWILQRKAAALRELGDFRAAKTTLGRYLSFAPEDDFEWTSLAIVHSELGEFDAAFECYERAEALNPNSLSMRFNWGLSAERAGRIDMARRQLDRLMESSPDGVQTHILRAYIHEHEGGLKSAWEAYECAMRAIDDSVDPSEAAYAFERAMEFCSEHSMRAQADSLIVLAFRRNACTPTLCESYRELSGEPMEKGYWFGLIAETAPVRDPVDSEKQAPTTTRGFQLIARDRDDALALLDRFLRKVGHRLVMLCEFIDEEPHEDDCTGVYEVEPITADKVDDTLDDPAES